MKPKLYKNEFYRGAKTLHEKCYWEEAKHFAAELLKYARIADAYHNGPAESGDNLGPLGPNATHIMNLATRLLAAENGAIDSRMERLELGRLVKEKKP